MAWKGNSSASFTGGSGQLAVMGELLHRGCNAAVPHIDVGTDVFAFRDDREDVARIQVKTAPGEPYRKKPGYRARFGVPMAQLKRTDEPTLFYAFAVRLDSGWEGSLLSAVPSCRNYGITAVARKTNDPAIWNCTFSFAQSTERTKMGLRKQATSRAGMPNVENST